MPYKDPERTREVARKWHWENRERKLEYNHGWYAANREHAAEYARQWREANPERTRARGARRRARKRGALCTECVDRRVVLESYGGICGICGDTVDPLNFHVDHIVPLSRGGDHTYANTQPAHPTCNLRKRDKLPEECSG